MRDIWGFLLQTLTASTAAVVLLLVKAMFRDKLPPRWQRSVWVLLLAVLLIPAGRTGRYALINWPLWVEALKTLLTGEYTLTQVTSPIPLPPLAAPETAVDWFYLIYLAVAAILLIRYLLSYAGLRFALRSGRPAGEETMVQIRTVAKYYDLPVCPVVEVAGISSAFLCGLFRPVLALPAGETVDEKVLLHELLHLKHKDVLWGFGICFFRCIHWCNPLLWYCADLVGNDVESACDQRVLERLEGETRRDYGRILLEMSNDRYARTPGTSSMANGGKNIRHRIQAIARFKKYPEGMSLVSVCVILMLIPHLIGVQAQSVYAADRRLPEEIELAVSMASARTIRCTTYAGAMDAYAKAVMTENGIYRAMCAPLSQHAELASFVEGPSSLRDDSTWSSGIPHPVNISSGYRIYNLSAHEDGAYEGLLVLESAQKKEDVGIYLLCQSIRAEKQDGRWVVIPQGAFFVTPTSWGSLPSYSCDELPAWYYEGEVGDFTIRLRYQTTYWIDSYVENSSDMSWFFGSSQSFDATPQPHGEFTGYDGESFFAIYHGNENQKSSIFKIGYSCVPLQNGEPSGDMRYPAANSAGSSSSGASWGSRSLSTDWKNEILLSGGGGSGDPEDFIQPEGFSAALYINGQKAGETKLLLTEGGIRYD